MKFGTFQQLNASGPKYMKFICSDENLAITNTFKSIIVTQSHKNPGNNR